MNMRNFSTLFPCIRVVHQTCANQWTKASSKLLTHKIFYPVVRSTFLQSYQNGARNLSQFGSVRNVSLCQTGQSYCLLTLRNEPPNRWTICRSFFAGQNQKKTYYKKTVLIYVCAVGIFMVGMTYAGVPLYRMFCQATGLGGKAERIDEKTRVENLKKVSERNIVVRFNADVSSSMQWNFRPQQTSVKVIPGETALAFYTAKNPTDKAIIGISTYNVIPYEAGLYFNKIQCFCFEEQRLNPHEQVDMPVFFYIDPDFAEDPKLEHVDTITLSYTFFEAKEGLKLPLPGYATT